MKHRKFSAALIACALMTAMAVQVACQQASDTSSNASGVQLTDSDGKVTVTIDGKLLTEYHYKDVPKPFFYPVIGPAGDPITRGYPMEPGENEATDHPHQRSFWYAHGVVNGVDFWAEGSQRGRIMQEKIIELTSGETVGVLKTQNAWVGPDGNVVCKDTRFHRFHKTTNGTLIDFEIIYHASEGEVTLGDTKEGTMAIRVAPTMRLTGPVAQGSIVNSEGQRDGETWGKRAAWCDYYGPVNDKVVGVAIFDHPANPKHPTWWHVRDYGLFAANPFGISDFENVPAGTGDIVIPQGEDLTWKYRFYLHLGDEKEGQVAERYEEYAATQ